MKKVSFHSNPKHGKCQRMFKVLHNCTHFTCQQSNAQNSPSQASTVCELHTFRCSSWIQKRQRNQRSNCQHPLNFGKAREFQKNTYFCFINYTKAIDCVDHSKLLNCSRDGNTIPPYLPPEKSVCRSRSNSQNWTWNNRQALNYERSTSRLYLSPCFFNIYAENIMRNAGLDEAQAGIKIARRNISNLRYADDATLMAESKEELKSLLMNVQEESEKVGLKLSEN